MFDVKNEPRSNHTPRIPAPYYCFAASIIVVDVVALVLTEPSRQWSTESRIVATCKWITTLFLICAAQAFEQGSTARPVQATNPLGATNPSLLSTSIWPRRVYPVQLCNEMENLHAKTVSGSTPEQRELA